MLVQAIYFRKTMLPLFPDDRICNDVGILDSHQGLFYKVDGVERNITHTIIPSVLAFTCSTARPINIFSIGNRHSLVRTYTWFVKKGQLMKRDDFFRFFYVFFDDPFSSLVYAILKYVASDVRRHLRRPVRIRLWFIVWLDTLSSSHTKIWTSYIILFIWAQIKIEQLLVVSASVLFFWLITITCKYGLLRYCSL